MSAYNQQMDTCGKLIKFLIYYFHLKHDLNFRGTFRMEREDRHTFDCRIPPFSLDSKHDPCSTNVNT